jgi:hypothetical protein
MYKHCHRHLVICLAILVIAGAATANASTLTFSDANCTGFALNGVAPDQTLDCLGGVGGGPSVSIKLVDKFCIGYSLVGVAPNQILVCTGSATAPTLQSVVSRKVHGASGKFDLPVLKGP